MASPTALIPAVFGILLVLLGMVARNPARRKMAMHIAVIVGIVGFFGSVRGLGATALMLTGQPAARPAAAISQAIMALLTLWFTVMCVRSFINARRAGTMEEAR
jgi:ABC-type Na+ efflux pump permease subunit